VKRWLLNITTGVSVVLLVAVVSLWVRSYCVSDAYYLDVVTRLGSGVRRIYYSSLDVSLGEVQVLFYHQDRPNPTFSAPVTDDFVGVSRSAWAHYNPKPLWHAHNSWLESLCDYDYETPRVGTSFVGGPSFRVSLAVPTVLFALLPAAHLNRYRRQRRRGTFGRCHRCGYDLRATPERCPECGATATPSRA
jgi:hypothetical protein